MNDSNVNESDTRLAELEVYACSLRGWDGKIKYEGQLILDLIHLVKKLRDFQVPA